MSEYAYTWAMSAAMACIFVPALLFPGVLMQEKEMRRAARVDASQQAIVSALRSIGASVAYIKYPVDLLVGYRGVTLAVEVKDGAKSPSKRRHTPVQEEFLRTWKGAPLITVLDPIGAIEAITKAAA